MQYFCNPCRSQQRVRSSSPFLSGCLESSFQSKQVSLSLFILVMLWEGWKVISERRGRLLPPARDLIPAPYIICLGTRLSYQIANQILNLNHESTKVNRRLDYWNLRAVLLWQKLMENGKSNGMIKAYWWIYKSEAKSIKLVSQIIKLSH